MSKYIVLAFLFGFGSNIDLILVFNLKDDPLFQIGCCPQSCLSWYQNSPS
uniref:Uncharacterized protein n=1 Tax=Arundo donax TaxID=35708 RepID=A0A0A9GW61_ARUDO